MKIKSGKWIKRHRTNVGWSQAELAKKMGVTGATISNWEQEKTSTDAKESAKLEKLMGENDDDSISSGPSAIGAWLGKARLAGNLSVRELADKAAVSIPTIYGLESGSIANPRPETVARLEKALGGALPADAKDASKEDATIEGLGILTDFDPHDPNGLPEVGGVYVFYDVSERPIYVGKSESIKGRVKAHADKFWFKSPIVHTASFVQIDDAKMRTRIEQLLIKFLKKNAVVNQQHVDR